MLGPPQTIGDQHDLSLVVPGFVRLCLTSVVAGIITTLPGPKSRQLPRGSALVGKERLHLQVQGRYVSVLRAGKLHLGRRGAAEDLMQWCNQLRSRKSNHGNHGNVQVHQVLTVQSLIF